MDKFGIDMELALMQYVTGTHWHIEIFLVRCFVTDRIEEQW
jgi:hypothetical protein